MNPQLSELVRMRMDILNQKYVATVTTRGLEFVAGVAAFTAYGRDTRRKMMRSLLDKTRSSNAPKGKCHKSEVAFSCFEICVAAGDQRAPTHSMYLFR